jgi:serine protease Do
MSIEGHRMKNLENIRDGVAAHRPSEMLEIRVVREGVEHTVVVSLTETPRSLRAQPTAAGAFPSAAYLGVFTEALADEQRQRLGVQVEHGVVLAALRPTSPAARAGLRRGDVVTAVGSIPVKMPEDLRAAVQKAGFGAEVTLEVSRGRERLSIRARLASAPPGADSLGQLLELPDRLQRLLEEQADSTHAPRQVPAIEVWVHALEQRVRDLEKKLAS